MNTYDEDGWVEDRTYSAAELELLDNPPFAQQEKRNYCPSDMMALEEDEITDNAKKRKSMPVYSGVLKYFPNAIKEVSKTSKAGNDQHHPDKPLHWDMSKSKDEGDALVRHLIDHSIDPVDDDGQLHLSKVAWRALAMLERYLTKNE